MLRVCSRFTPNKIFGRQQCFCLMMTFALILLIPISTMASAQVTMSLGLGANNTEKVAGYRIYYKNGSPGNPYNGSGLNLGNSPVDIPISGLAGATTHLHKTIDDGDAGTSSTGTWSVSGGTSPFGTQSLYSKENGAEYSFEYEQSGRFEVAMWWSGYKSRCSDVPVYIYDGNVLIDTVRVDQLQNSEKWNALGTYNFSSTPRVAVVSESEECSTSVDAVRFACDEVTLTGLMPGETYYFVATVYDDNGTESTFSKEVAVTTEDVAPLIITHEITASVKGNGTISPSGVTSVDEGESLVFEIAPDPNYHIADVLVDGVSVGASSSYTLNQISADHKIEAYFDADQIVVVVDPDNDDSSDPYIDDTVGSDTGDLNSEIIIDDGDFGTSPNGNWKFSNGTNPFGKQSLYSKEVGADYEFEAKLTGRYNIALWWSGYNSRCSNVPVEIYDGDTLLDTVNVNQSQNSGQWYTLRSYDFSGDAKVTIVSDSSECSTSADAIKFVLDSEVKIIDNEEAEASFTGAWPTSGGTDPFGEQSLYSRQADAEFTYTAQAIGYHEVALWWSGYKSRCAEVPVEIYDGDMLLDRVYVDQSENSGQWNVLGSYDFNWDAKVIIFSKSNKCSTSADALRLAVKEKIKVMDEGDDGTSSSGVWSFSKGTEPFDGESLYSKQIDAEYTFTAKIDGIQEVALWWSGYKSRCDDVPVEIYNGDILKDKVYIDQSHNSGQWNVLGTYDFNEDADTRVTIISNSTECSTSADALKFSK